ncbi:PBP1A family penicillin-binding protein [Chitinimonas arctica]|uniref:Penicillin-binding protein 1A n=1 Tax=Chitinimonas arctica TaxID=2594795 RepID=A0A516SB78_9NEIS|nr:PBP1A family penicillin-binding protein [Chitinimonas arctica]QDQ25400.1 PBP1A family penicillin-binding protein [Chitinimonas arctica]
MIALAGGLWWLGRELPSLDELDNLQPKLPMRVYSSDGVLIGEFGRERRSMLKLADTPIHLKQAVLAIEDARFYEHGAIDIVGVLRAGMANLSSGGTGQGASTITMQLARDLFLTREKNWTRKLREILVAYKIEAVRSKDEILELYLNQIYLGQRSYGFASAARIYFGKEVREITLAEAAMLAGLPKAPAAYNPVVNPTRARVRQVYILKRMHELGYIDAASYQRALAEPLKLADGQISASAPSPHAEYLAEMVRQQMVAQYGESAYARGLVIKTTLDYATQTAAWEAVSGSLLEFDRRRGYRGPEGFVALPADADEQADAVADALESHPDADQLTAAVVLSVSGRGVKVMDRDGDTQLIPPSGLRFAAAGMRSDASPQMRIRPGAMVRISGNAEGKPEIGQLPEIQGALVALAPQDGAIRALVGGFDFKANPFNRVTQAIRQPGSTFKPFVYSAALEKGVGPATLVNDSPMSFRLDPNRDEQWQPKNDDGAYLGPITLRRGLQKSKNMVALRVLENIGVDYARNYIVTRFNFSPKQVPPYLPMALGAGQVTPLQLAGGYAVFANGGYRVKPYFILEVRDGKQQVLQQAQPALAAVDAPRAISAANAFLMNDLLTGVAQHGTAYQSNSLGRTDLAGKTGTTNDARDGWFAGYQHTLVAVSWIGFDQPRPLGSSAGSQLALPQWMRFMGKVLKGVPTHVVEPVPGVSQLNGEWYMDSYTPGNGFVGGIGTQGMRPSTEEEEVPEEEVVEPEETDGEAEPSTDEQAPRDREKRDR